MADRSRGPWQAFDSVYRENYDFIARSVRRLGIPDAAAEDVAQEVFVVAHRRLRRFEGRSSVKTWLFGIARRVAKDHRRSARRAQRRLRRTWTTPLPVGPTHDACPERRTARERASQTLCRIIDELGAKRRAVFVLAEIEERSAPEIAHLLGINCNTVYSRLRLAREAFAKAVDAERRATA